MASSHWHSFEEYKDCVRPGFLDHPGPWRTMRGRSLFQNIVEGSFYYHRMEDEMFKLRNLFRDLEAARKLTPSQSHQAFLLVEKIAMHAEHLFLYYRPLIEERRSEDFLDEKSLYQHWERYEKAERLYRELEDFIEAADRVLEEYGGLQASNESFLLEDIDELPEQLTVDFKVGRDLFSVGVEEGGAFFAGRGLEAVLREIARKHRIRLQQQRKEIAVYEADFRDIIEALSRARWKSDNSPVVDKRLKSLLDLLRNARNAAAHPSTRKGRRNGEPDWQEIAKLSAKAANAVWLTSGKGRRRLVSERIVRDW